MVKSTAVESNGAMGRLRLGRRGDINAFFGLMLDNIGVMILMASLLVVVFDMPRTFVLTRMIPGTAVGVLVGDLIYTFMAFRLARKTGRSDVTAMPLGLDTPSTFGTVFLIIGPAYQAAMQARSRCRFVRHGMPGFWASRCSWRRVSSSLRVRRCRVGSEGRCRVPGCLDL